MKAARCVLKIAAAVAMAAAAACAIVAYWDRIADAFYTIADRLEERKANRCFESDEFDDYADIEDI